MLFSNSDKVSLGEVYWLGGVVSHVRLHKFIPQASSSSDRSYLSVSVLHSALLSVPAAPLQKQACEISPVCL